MRDPSCPGVSRRSGRGSAARILDQAILDPLAGRTITTLSDPRPRMASRQRAI